ncbi:MAG: hypothetical protein NVV83_01565 [Afipia sp.]|nr:hypothetical protein [Afipia sp.]
MPRLKLTALDSKFSNLSFVELSIARAESARRSAIAASLVRLLKADELDRSAIAELALRHSYPLAFDTLARLAKLDDASVAVLIEPAAPAVRAFRAARAFRVIVREDEATAFGLDDLHAIGTEPAMCALAACGVIDWKREKRTRPRAVFVLRALIGAGRS